jgi:hypothetical protein
MVQEREGIGVLNMTVEIIRKFMVQEHNSGKAYRGSVFS